MQPNLPKTLIQLKSGLQLHYDRFVCNTKFGFTAMFRTLQQPSQFYHINTFSKSLLQINNLKSHLQQTLAQWQKLSNSRFLCPIVERLQLNDTIYVISQVANHSLLELLENREGLTEYEVVYFVTELFEGLNYLKSRDLFFEKLELQMVFLAEGMKVSLVYGIMVNFIENDRLMRRLTFRDEVRDGNNCPELVIGVKAAKHLTKQQKLNENKDPHAQSHSVNLVNSWTMGVLIYQLFENSKPFATNVVVNGSHSGLNDEEMRAFYELKFYQTSSKEGREMVGKLLQVDIKKRLNFPLILIQPMMKKMGPVAYMLPETIFSCPPGQEFKEQFKRSLQERNKGNLNLGNGQSTKPNGEQRQYNNSRSLKRRNENNTRTQIVSSSISNIGLFQLSNGRRRKESLVLDQQLEEVQHPVAQTQKYIKVTERSLTENKIYIEEFVDISHVYGYGYQMNTGTVCFVYNDGSQFYFPNFSRKYLVYVTEKGALTSYTYDKLPEEQQLKKKIFILEAYSKSIKKFKNPTQQVGNGHNQKTITVSKYGRTKHAAIFYLSNESVQVFFNDKICFLMTRSSLFVLAKNGDKYEKYDYRNETNEMKTRRDYVVGMAVKIFGWRNEKGQEEGGDDQQLQRSKKISFKKKDSILAQLQEQSPQREQRMQQREERLQSLKKFKQKQERSFRKLKKSIASQEKIDYRQ